MIKMRNLLKESDSEFQRYLGIYKDELQQLKSVVERVEETVNDPDFKLLSIGSGIDGIISKIRNAKSELNRSIERIPQWIRIEKNKTNSK